MRLPLENEIRSKVRQGWQLRKVRWVTGLKRKFRDKFTFARLINEATHGRIERLFSSSIVVLQTLASKTRYNLCGPADSGLRKCLPAFSRERHVKPEQRKKTFGAVWGPNLNVPFFLLLNCVSQLYYCIFRSTWYIVGWPWCFCWWHWGCGLFLFAKPVHGSDVVAVVERGTPSRIPACRQREFGDFAVAQLGDVCLLMLNMCAMQQESAESSRGRVLSRMCSWNVLIVKIYVLHPLSRSVVYVYWFCTG